MTPALSANAKKPRPGAFILRRTVRARRGPNRKRDASGTKSVITYMKQSGYDFQAQPDGLYCVRERLDYACRQTV